MAGVIPILGAIRHRHAVGVAPAVPAMPAGGFQALRAKLATRNWAWVPWGFWKEYAYNKPKFFTPFSPKEKRKALVENKRLAILNIAAMKPAIDPDMVKTFKRIKDVSSELGTKPGKTLEQCADNVAQIRTEIAGLVAARDSYRKSAALKLERVPKLDAGTRAQLLAAKMTQEVAEAIAFDCSDAKNALTPVAAKAIIDAAANSVVARYAVATGCPIDVTNAAIVAAGTITTPLAGVSAIATANTALDAALGAAKTAEKVLARATYFRGCAQFDLFAKTAEVLERKLKVAAGEVFDSLCNAENEVYENQASFETLYEGVFEEYSRVADATQELDAFRLSLGLPALRRDKLEGSGMYAFKKALTENAASRNEYIGGAVLTGVEYGLYTLVLGGSIPGWLVGGGLLIGASVLNTVAIKAIQAFSATETM